MDTQVLIAGGGPVGLITAMELNKQGIKAILIERNPTTTKHPKMDITNGRSMELFRRWGCMFVGGGIKCQKMLWRLLIR